jgi:hypothetical protein
MNYRQYDGLQYHEEMHLAQPPRQDDRHVLHSQIPRLMHPLPMTSHLPIEVLMPSPSKRQYTDIEATQPNDALLWKRHRNTEEIMSVRTAVSPSVGYIGSPGFYTPVSPERFEQNFKQFAMLPPVDLAPNPVSTPRMVKPLPSPTNESSPTTTLVPPPVKHIPSDNGKRKWELIRSIGKGGCGEVYLAKEVTGNNLDYVALKIVKVPQQLT